MPHDMHSWGLRPAYAAGTGGTVFRGHPFVAGRVEAEHWYLGRGRANPPTSAECRAALRDHMPELLPHYDRVCGLVAVYRPTEGRVDYLWPGKSCSQRIGRFHDRRIYARLW